MRNLAVLGQCAPGLQAVQVMDYSLLFSDNPHNSTAAFVDASNPAYTGSLAALPLQDPARAVRELRRAVTGLGLCGALVNDHTQIGRAHV